MSPAAARPKFVPSSIRHQKDSIMPPIVRRFWSQPRRILTDLLAVDDSAHAVAAGAAVGIFLGLTPTVGIQMILVALIALCARGWLYFNRTAALLMVYITNPLTIVPIYWFNYRVGAAVVGGDADRSELASAVTFDGLANWWDSMQALAITVGWPLLVGSLIVATIGATATYPAVRWMVRKLRAPAVETESIAIETPVDDAKPESTIEQSAIEQSTIEQAPSRQDVA